MTVDDDSIKFLGAASIAYNFGNYIDGNWSRVIIINKGNYQHSFENDLAGVTIQALSGDNTITNGYYGEQVSIDCGTGNDSILNNGSQATVKSGASVLIDGGTGNDTIWSNSGNNVTIDCNDGNDFIKKLFSQRERYKIKA